MKSARQASLSICRKMLANLRPIITGIGPGRLQKSDGVAARTFPGRRTAKALLPGCAVILLFQAVGCGEGFTNDGIPDGKSVVEGQVVHAENPQLPVANATVTITTTLTGKAVSGRADITDETFEVITDANGDFLVKSIPTDSVASNVTVAVDPNDPTIQKQRFSFLVTNNRPTDLIVALPQASFDLSQVSAVSLIPQSGSPPGTVQLKSQVLDRSGNVLNIVPTLILDGSIGQVGPDGLYTLMGLSTTASTTSNVTATIDVGSQKPPATTVPITIGPTVATSNSFPTAVAKSAGRRHTGP